MLKEVATDVGAIGTDPVVEDREGRRTVDWWNVAGTRPARLTLISEKEIDANGQAVSTEDGWDARRMNADPVDRSLVTDQDRVEIAKAIGDALGIALPPESDEMDSAAKKSLRDQIVELQDYVDRQQAHVDQESDRLEVLRADLAALEASA